MTQPRVLVAGVGNIFFGDDGFGSEVVRRLRMHALPSGVAVFDFGIRGFDLMYALLDGYRTAILIDTRPGGGPPGTLYVVEPEVTETAATFDTHGMDPVRVLAAARSMGPLPNRVLLVGCEPFSFGPSGEGRIGLSEPVARSVDDAVTTVQSLAEEALVSKI